MSGSNIENLSFVIRLGKIFKIKKKNLTEAVKNFKGLRYRQQIIFKNKNLTIINDSKSTSYSSSTEILKEKNNIYWLVGGIPKRGDNAFTKIITKKSKATFLAEIKKKFLADLKIRLK